MAQPRAYTRQANFTDHTTESPSDPQVGSKLDSEFDALNLTPVPRHPAPRHPLKRAGGGAKAPPQTAPITPPVPVVLSRDNL